MDDDDDDVSEEFALEMEPDETEAGNTTTTTTKTTTEHSDGNMDDSSGRDPTKKLASSASELFRSHVMREVKGTFKSVPVMRKSAQSSRSVAGQTIVVREDETPSRRLLLRMISLQQHLQTVNERVMSGLAVPREDWTGLRSLCEKLGTAFQNEVQFDWEASSEALYNGSRHGSHDIIREEGEGEVEAEAKMSDR
jgi:hypothetical protein